MAKAKKVEKRSAPKKAAKPVKFVCKECREGRCTVHGTPKKPVPKRKPDPEGYAKLAHAIMHGDAGGKKPAKKEEPTRAEKRLAARYPERIPEKPPEPEAPKIEITVRSIYYDGQYLPALCFRKPGAMHVPCVAGDPVNGVRKFTVAAAQHDKSPIVQHGYGNFAAPYSPEKFAAHMRRIAAAAPITPEARTMLLPYCPDMPHGPAALPVAIGAGAATPDDEAQPVRSRTQPGNGSRAPAGPARTSGKELIRTLAAAAKLPPEKVRAKLRAAGMRAPYTDEGACRKALGVKA